MSTTGSQMHENALLNQQVEMLARDSAALSTATSRGRAIRLVLFVLLVAMLGFFCYSFYHMGDRMINGADYHKQLLDAAQKHFETNQKVYMNDLQGVYNNTAPALTKAGLAQVKKDMPLFLEILQTQRDALVKELNEKMTERLTKRYDRLVTDRQDVLKKAMPEITDPRQQERIEKNMQAAVNNLIKRWYIDKMDQQVRFAFDQWDGFPTAPPRQPGTDSLEDQMSGMLFDLTTYRLAHSSASYNTP